jgi:hypothetical protein
VKSFYFQFHSKRKNIKEQKETKEKSNPRTTYLSKPTYCGKLSFLGSVVKKPTVKETRETQIPMKNKVEERAYKPIFPINNINEQK